MQLLLLLPDRTLTSLIDDGVLSKTIKIPLGETRELSYQTDRHASDAGSQLSALGIRSNRLDAAINLTSTVWHAYQRLGLTNELEWRVRGDASKSPYEAFVAFVRNRGPADSIRELVLSSVALTKAVCEDVDVPVNRASAADNLAVDHMLWKFGFNPMQFDDSITRFKRRLSDFNQAILANTPIEAEDARGRVRAVGVNVFVSLEEVLDRLISYNVWLLSSDHFVSTKFKYSSVRARRAVPLVLGQSLSSGGTSLSWNPDGENPLGTLLRYLRAATDWIQSLPGKDRDSLRRSEQDLPHFAGDKHVMFPFRHVTLWADADLGELQRHVDLFGRIVKLIEECEPANLRNGLDHFREAERFPSADKLLACVVRLGQSLELADDHRFLPKVFWLSSVKENRFGATEYDLCDYAGRLAVGYGPPLVSGLPPVSYESACLLAPGNLLGVPNATLFFHLREPSEFSAYWQDYPRRPTIPVATGDELATQALDQSPKDEGNSPSGDGNHHRGSTDRSGRVESN